MESGLCTCLSGVSEKETAIFTMTKGKIYVCNGKKCKRLDFLTMTKVNFRNFMVKSGQGRCEETCSHFFVAFTDSLKSRSLSACIFLSFPKGRAFSEVEITS